MKPMIAIFKFTIRNGQSVGPAVLQRTWEKACRTLDVSVGRDLGVRAGDRPTYLLFGRQNLENVPDIEKRLRILFDEMDLRVSMICVDRA